MLNNQQLDVVNSKAKRLLCLAGAGTGKTTCLIERISKIIERGADPKSILVLTFTNAAAFEMKERFLKKSNSANIPEFRTFHSFCYYLLASDKNILHQLGYTSVPKVADEANVRRITKEAALQVNVNLSQDKLNGKKSLTQYEQYQYDILKKAENRIMRQKNFITFDSLCYDVCKLFVDDDPMVDKYKARFKYVYADEQQDTDPRQWDFIQSFTNSEIFLVGDALQALYSFRGADSSIIKSIAEDTNWVTKKLAVNYRSGSTIVDFANSISSYAKDSYRIVMESSRRGGDVITSSYKNFGNRGSVPTQCLLKCEQLARTLEGSTAFLFRTNAEVGDLSSYFDNVGVSYVSGKQDIDVPHILNSIYDNNYLVDWLSTFLNADLYSDYVRSSFVNSENHVMELSDFVDRFGTVKMIHDKLEIIYTIRSEIKSCKSIEEICKKLSELLKVNIEVPEISPKKYSDLIEYAKSCLSEVNYDSTIYVGTIHSSKGLEYDNVILCGVNGKSFPLTSEENKNVYYVGVTRAKNFLYIMEEK